MMKNAVRSQYLSVCAICISACLLFLWTVHISGETLITLINKLYCEIWYLNTREQNSRLWHILEKMAAFEGNRSNLQRVHMIPPLASFFQELISSHIILTTRVYFFKRGPMLEIVKWPKDWKISTNGLKFLKTYSIFTSIYAQFF
jgi:hypothetical protein